MDAEGRIIPIVEDDQGEGWRDLVEEIPAPLPKGTKAYLEEMKKRVDELTKEIEDKNNDFLKED